MVNWKGKRKAEASLSHLFVLFVILGKKKKILFFPPEKVGKLLFAALGYCDIRRSVLNSLHSA